MGVFLILAGPWGPASLGSGRAPRLVAAWAAGPLELRLAFDAPVADGAEAKLVGRAIDFTIGRGASATRGRLRIAAARRLDGGRTLALATDPHARQADYRLDLAGVSDAGVVHYDLSGVEVSWSEDEAAAEPTWSGWWPSPDPAEVRRRLAGSVEHERALALLARPGNWTVRGLVLLPAGKPRVRIESNRPFEANLGGVEAQSQDGPGGRQRADLEPETAGEPVELWLSATTGKGPGPLVLQVSVGSGDAFRPIETGRWLLPWTPAPMPASVPPRPLPFDLKAGDPKRGEAVFFSDEAKCSTCHKVGGRGGDVGPALDSLTTRDPATLFREVAEPSVVINPDYVPYTVALKSGEVVNGVVRAEGGDAIRVLETDGKATLVKRADIEELRPSGTSIMPVGLAGILGEARMRDLLAFLLARRTESSRD